MITRELWVWAIECVLCVVLMVIYMAYTWGDLQHQRRVPPRTLKARSRRLQAESNLLAGIAISWLVLCATGAAVIFLVRATGSLEAQEWAKIGAWMLIVQLLGVPAWVLVKLANRRKLDTLE